MCTSRDAVNSLVDRALTNPLEKCSPWLGDKIAILFRLFSMCVCENCFVSKHGWRKWKFSCTRMTVPKRTQVWLLARPISSLYACFPFASCAYHIYMIQIQYTVLQALQFREVDNGSSLATALPEWVFFVSSAHHRLLMPLIEVNIGTSPGFPGFLSTQSYFYILPILVIFLLWCRQYKFQKSSQISRVRNEMDFWLD